MGIMMPCDPENDTRGIMCSISMLIADIDKIGTPILSITFCAYKKYKPVLNSIDIPYSIMVYRYDIDSSYDRMRATGRDVAGSRAILLRSKNQNPPQQIKTPPKWMITLSLSLPFLN